MANGNIGRDKYRQITRELREWGYLPIPERTDKARLNPRDWNILRVIVFERDGYQCVYCGDGCDDPHCDHVVPVSRGGTNEIENLATACPPCNLSKGDKMLSEWNGRKF
ncbi:MAG: HNH endonuclease [Parvibaculum sp.]|nr:HNH endonuclease [Parvibaculum sp.]